MNLSDLDEVIRARSERRTVAVVTPLDGRPSRLVALDDVTSDPLADVLSARFAAGTSARVATAAGDVFVRVHRPSPRLVVIGAVHVTQALAPMAIATGFDVTIVDPREAFASPERFSACDLRAEWPEASRLGLDRETAVAAITHDPKIDDPALMAALDADCFYVGALGSRKTHARRVERLTAAGYTQGAMDRIHAPIGLPIGAASPAEIAVSVLAEIIAALRRGGRASAPAREQKDAA